MKTVPGNYSDFLLWLAIILVAGSAMVVGFVLIVDPYGLYGIVSRPGINQVKPALTRYQNEIKLSHAVRSHAAKLILGNSRAEIGFDPDTPIFSSDGSVGYNLAIAGTGIQSSIEQLEYLRSAGLQPKTVVLGIEFLDFVSAPVTNSRAASTPAVPEKQLPANKRYWRFDALYSFASIKDAIRTLRIQHDKDAETITSKGFNPLKEYNVFARIDGYHQMFAQRAEENARTYLRKAAGSFNEQEASESVRKVLDLLGAAGSEVHLTIYPYHAQILILFEETGLNSSFNAWKDLLVAEVAAARRRYPSAQITLHDFSGFGYFNCEAIPAKNDRSTAMRWYWEGGHFKKELGDIVLRKMLSTVDRGPLDHDVVTAFQGFGMRLDENTRTANLQRISSERANCAERLPELFSETKALVTKIRSN